MISAKELKIISDMNTDRISRLIGTVAENAFKDIKQDLIFRANRGHYSLTFFLGSYLTSEIKDLDRENEVFEVFSRMLSEAGYETRYTTDYKNIFISW